MKLTFNHYLIAISILFFVVRVNSLGFDQTNNDSIRWFNRSEGFLTAIKTFNFNQTYQTYHPGVSLMLVNSFFRQIFYTYQYSALDSKINIMSPDNFVYLNFFSKLANIFVLFLCLLLQAFLIKKLWRMKVSLLYFFFLACEPYFIGINRWFHLTSFEVVFSFTAILLILYWNKFASNIHLYLSALFLTLAVLTKVTTLILIPIFFFILFKNYLQNKDIRFFLRFIGVFVITLFLFFPALWVTPIQTLGKILGSIFHAVSEDPRKFQLNYYTNLFYYPLILLLKLSPLTIVLFSLALLNFKKIQNYEFNILLFVGIFYLLFLSLSDQKIDRYSMVFFQPIILISAIFVAKFEDKFIYVYASFVLIFLAFVYVFYSPQYSSYYNPMLGGTKTALDIGLYENGGSYFNEAAFYLNNKSIKDSVLVPDNYEAFSMFYLGRSLMNGSSNYKYVVSSLDIDRKNFNNFECDSQIASFGPADYKVVAIFECK